MPHNLSSNPGGVVVAPIVLLTQQHIRGQHQGNNTFLDTISGSGVALGRHKATPPPDSKVVLPCSSGPDSGQGEWCCPMSRFSAGEGQQEPKGAG